MGNRNCILRMLHADGSCGVFRLIGWIVALGLTAAGPARAHAQEAPPPPTQSLVALTENNLPPFLFEENDGQLRGIHVAIWKKWTALTRTNLEIRPMAWNEVLTRFRQGEGDLIIGIIESPERAEWLDFTDPIFMTRLECYYNRKLQNIGDLNDLAGRPIGVVAEDYSSAYLQEHLPDGVRVHEYTNLIELFDGLKRGEIEAFIGYRTIMPQYLAARGLERRYITLPESLEVRQVRAAVRKGDHALRERINTGLAMLNPQEINDIVMQWITPPRPARIPWGWLALAVALIAVVLMTGVAINKGLRERIAAATLDLQAQRAELERALQAARRNEQRLLSFATAFPGMMFIFDAEGHYRDIFGGADDLLYATREALLGKTVNDQLPPKAAMPIMQAIAGALATHGLSTVEYELVVPAGRRIFEGRVVPLPGRPGDLPLVVFLAVDITVRKQLGEQLRQSQKMEAVGRLAGGVAHDFNNILTALMGFCELGLESAAPWPEQARLFEDIMETAQRAAALTRQLLAFSRRQVFAPAVLDLNEVIASTEKMLGRLIGENIQLETRFDPALPPVLADAGQIEQVILNLAVNARDAMPQGGRLTIATRAVGPDDPTLGPTANLPPGRYAAIEVSDTGEGIDESVLPRIFEPFFTTKAHFKGTGLGLSMVYGIVTQSGGDIDCQSKPGEGSLFRIYLPVSRQEPAQAPDERPGLPEARNGQAHLMLVEDDPVVRGLIRKMLVARGYVLTEADGGARALELARDPALRIDLLVTDVVMPEINGNELVQQMNTIRPGLKVLYISGYSIAEIEQLGIYEGSAALLVKPFRAQELTAKIEEILDGRGKSVSTNMIKQVDPVIDPSR